MGYLHDLDKLGASSGLHLAWSLDHRWHFLVDFGAGFLQDCLHTQHERLLILIFPRPYSMHELHSVEGCRHLQKGFDKHFDVVSRSGGVVSSGQSTCIQPLRPELQQLSNGFCFVQCCLHFREISSSGLQSHLVVYIY